MNAGIVYSVISALGLAITFFIARYWSKNVGKGGNAVSMGLTIALVAYVIAMLPFMLPFAAAALALNVIVLCLARFYGVKLLFPGGLTPAESLYLGLGFAIFVVAAPMVFGGVWKLQEAIGALEIATQLLLTICGITVMIGMGVITGYALYKNDVKTILYTLLTQVLYVLPEYFSQSGITVFHSNILYAAYSALVAGGVFYYTRIMYNRWKDETAPTIIETES